MVVRIGGVSRWEFGGVGGMGVGGASGVGIRGGSEVRGGVDGLCGTSLGFWFLNMAR